MTLLRSALFNCWFYGVTLLFCLAAPPVLLQVRRTGRGAAQRHARRWAQVVLAGMRPLAGLHWRIEGEVPGAGPALLAAQHQSAFETVLWVTLLPDFCFVVKQELLRIPLFGALLRAGGMVAVDRAGGAAAMRGLLRDGGRALNEGRQLVIFPEGTRVEPGAAVRLHPGVAALAARTGLPVIPVATDSGRFWGRRAFRKRAGTIRVSILPALPAGLPREALLNRLETAYSAPPDPWA